MIRQILSLLSLLIAASLCIGYVALPKARIVAQVAEYVSPDGLLQLVVRGAWPTYVSLQLFRFQSVGVWFGAGIALALFARIGLWWWNRSPDEPKEMRLRDEAGGTVTMFQGTLNHDPGIRFVSVPPNAPRIDLASDFENEMFAFVTAAEGLPANIEGDQRALLADHVRSAYRYVLNEHKPGSMATMLLVAYQTGKVLSAVKKGGAWVMVSDKFAQQSMVIVRRFRGYYSLAPAERAQLMRCLSILATRWVPVDLSDEDHDLVRVVRIADMAQGAKRTTASQSQEPEIDIRGIAASVSTSIVAAFAKFNVNQKRSASDPLDALFIKKDGVLLVPPKQMREALATLLPDEISNALQLSMPASSKHPSDRILQDVLLAAGILSTVLRDVRCDSGMFRVRSGSRKWPAMWALSTKNTKQETIDSWGDWSFEIEIFETGETHVG